MIRVVKVGGSLFDLPDLVARLRDWSSRQRPAHQVLIAGGGPLVDQVRRSHAARPIDEATAHWMCVNLMSTTAKWLHDIVPGIPLVEDIAELEGRARAVGETIFDPGSWLRMVEPRSPGTRLPCTWDTTSDSIAGRLAATLGAAELVLLKSALPPANSPGHLDDLATVGYVDAMFPLLAAELPPTRFVDFRSTGFHEVQWRKAGS